MTLFTDERFLQSIHYCGPLRCWQSEAFLPNRERTPESEQNTKEELSRIGIHYDYLKITGEKTKYILDNSITVYFDDSDEYFLDIPETVAVFKIRESWNFDFDEHKWLYSNKTGRNIDKGV